MCYHRGSATVKAVQGKEDTLGQGRRLFLQKHGVDPWGDGFCYDFQGVQQYQFTSAQEFRRFLLHLLRAQKAGGGVRDGKLQHLAQADGEIGVGEEEHQLNS